MPAALGIRRLCAALALAAGCASAEPRFVAPPEPRSGPPAPVTSAAGVTPGVEAPSHPTSDPYRGDLSIFEQPGRAERLQIDRVMDILGIHAGSVVADLGAGSGWFTVRAARRVGDKGLVYAIEINQTYLDHIAARATAEHFTNIRTVLGGEDDPRLPAASVDAVLLLKTYHELSAPLPVMRKLRLAMRPGARLGIIDKNGRGDDHGLDRDLLVREVERAGLSLLQEYDFVKPEKLDYFLVFAANGSP